MSITRPNSMAHPVQGPDAAVMVGSYRRLVRKRVLLLVVLCAASLGSLGMDVGTGSSGLGLRTILQWLLGSVELSSVEQTILWQVRLPQSLLAVLVGVALSSAGAEMQTILNNPMASPFTLGVSSAATFGAALAIVVGAGIPGIPQDWFLPANAFVFAFGSVLLLQSIARRRGSETEVLVLCGIALFFTFNALVALTQFLASQQALQQLIFWMMGSLARASWDKVCLLAIVVAIVLPCAFAVSWQMMALRLGEDRARTIGIDIGRLRFFTLLRISILTATSMAFVGTIGFVGLAGPHIARLMIGEDHRFFLPASAMIGAIIMSLAAIASKSIIPGVLIPTGIVTAMIGLPVFFSLILGRRYS